MCICVTSRQSIWTAKVRVCTYQTKFSASFCSFALFLQGLFHILKVCHPDFLRNVVSDRAWLAHRSVRPAGDRNTPAGSFPSYGASGILPAGKCRVFGRNMFSFRRNNRSLGRYECSFGRKKRFLGRNRHFRRRKCRCSRRRRNFRRIPQTEGSMGRHPGVRRHTLI